MNLRCSQYLSCYQIRVTYYITIMIDTIQLLTNVIVEINFTTLQLRYSGT